MSKEEELKFQNQLQIELPDDIAEGIYSNLAIITHSTTEFAIDFIRVMPGMPKAKVKSRIILTPQHAKRLANAMKDNVANYKKTFGKIREIENQQTPLSFGGPTAQA